VTVARVERVVERVRRVLDDDAVLTGEAVRARSAGIWGSPRSLVAAGLVRPADTRGVAATLEICNELGQPVVTHGGLTGVVDGAWAEPGELVLSLERMNQIEEVDELGRTMIVQAGAPLASVQAEAERHGLFFPLDLGARGSATIGGNAATNAGGNRVIRYGMARALILGLEAVLADGTVVSSMNAMLKNNAGYDLKHLFIGSEGTLGVVTRLVLRLTQRPATESTALVAMDSFAQMARFLAFADGALGGTLSAFEAMWADYYAFVTELDGPGGRPLPADAPFYAIVEALGGDHESDAERFEAVLGRALDKGLIVDAVIAKSGAERDRIWRVRDEVMRLLDIDPMFLFDVSLPIRHMERYVEQLRRDLTDQWPAARLFVFGHLGDCNLHLGVAAGPPDGGARSAVEQAVYGPLRPIGGSVSAEHGIGLEKKPYLAWCRSGEEIDLMRMLKRNLDPNGILNPGKIFDTS
jgi:FAD/FMN-containing dehydrogenase